MPGYNVRDGLLLLGRQAVAQMLARIALEALVVGYRHTAGIMGRRRIARGHPNSAAGARGRVSGISHAFASRAMRRLTPLRWGCGYDHMRKLRLCNVIPR